MIKEKLSWNDAEIRCKKEGGHLASIHSKEENDFVTKIVSVNDKHNPWYWIGANDLLSDGLFVWSDESALNYSNWKVGEPNNGVAGAYQENCVQIVTMDRRGHNGKWVDIQCKRLHHFVCKIG